MALRWLRRWCKPHARDGDRVFEDEKAKLLVPVSRVQAAQYHNSTQPAGSLFKLPGDLLSWVCQYLTTEEVLTLMLSCSEFWRSRNATGAFSRMWQRITLPVGNNLSILAERFHVLRMLEYDGLLQGAIPPKYCCWGCMGAHEQKSFRRKEFRKKVDLKSNYPLNGAARRSCQPGGRYIWVGAFREMSFAELRHSIVSQEVQQDNTKREIPTGGAGKPAPRNGLLFNPQAQRFEYFIHIDLARKFESFDSFWRATSSMNISLCPHLEMRTAEVAKLYKNPSKPYFCIHCPTTVQMRIDVFVTVYVFRYVGSLLSPMDPTWMAQSYVSSSPPIRDYNHRFCEWFEKNFEMRSDGMIISHDFRRPVRLYESDYRPFKGAVWSPDAAHIPTGPQEEGRYSIPPMVLPKQLRQSPLKMSSESS